jgi:hypothetical protein
MFQRCRANSVFSNEKNIDSGAELQYCLTGIADDACLVMLREHSHAWIIFDDIRRFRDEAVAPAFAFAANQAAARFFFHHGIFLLVRCRSSSARCLKWHGWNLLVSDGLIRFCSSRCSAFC